MVFEVEHVAAEVIVQVKSTRLKATCSSCRKRTKKQTASRSTCAICIASGVALGQQASLALQDERAAPKTCTDKSPASSSTRSSPSVRGRSGPTGVPTRLGSDRMPGRPLVGIPTGSVGSAPLASTSVPTWQPSRRTSACVAPPSSTWTGSLRCSLSGVARVLGGRARTDQSDSLFVLTREHERIGVEVG